MATRKTQGVSGMEDSKWFQTCAVPEASKEVEGRKNQAWNPSRFLRTDTSSFPLPQPKEVRVGFLSPGCGVFVSGQVWTGTRSTGSQTMPPLSLSHWSVLSASRAINSNNIISLLGSGGSMDSVRTLVWFEPKVQTDMGNLKYKVSIFINKKPKGWCGSKIYIHGIGGTEGDNMNTLTWQSKDKREDTNMQNI